MVREHLEPVAATPAKRPALGARVYFLRHQAAGVLHELPFKAEPNELQIAAVKAHCVRRWGKEHPKTGRYWLRIVHFSVLASNIPEFDTPAPGKDNGATAPKYGVSGAGTVRAGRS